MAIGLTFPAVSIPLLSVCKRREHDAGYRIQETIWSIEKELRLVTTHHLLGSGILFVHYLTRLVQLVYGMIIHSDFVVTRVAKHWSLYIETCPWMNCITRSSLSNRSSGRRKR
jgi:hypothetical protein